MKLGGKNAFFSWQTLRNGEVVSRSLSTGSLLPTTYSYDDKGRVTSSSVGDRGVSYTYDSKGNVATITDSKNQTTYFTYDVMDRVVEIKYPNDTIETYTYDNNGNTKKFVTATPTNHTFDYNGVDLKTNYTSPLQKATLYNYDKNRRITSIVKPSSKTITYNYDKDRLATVVTDESTTNYSYISGTKVGSITKGGEGFSFTYDGTLLTSMSQSGILNHTINYSYNNDFTVTSIEYAGGTVNYSYDKDGLLLSSGSYSITRDSENGLATSLTDTTLTQTRTYNGYGELSTLSDNTFGYELSYNELGEISQKIERMNNQSSTYNYSYDNMGRVIEVKKDGVIVEAYSYDKNGNRVSATINNQTTNGYYTLDDQIVTYGDNTYHYNDDGYLQTKTTVEGTTTYQYGIFGELQRVVTATQTIEYLHNANNQRVAKKVDGVITEKYLWANLTTLLAIYDKDNLLQRFEYADQRMPIAMMQNNQKYYLHYDQVGSLRAITDTNHNIIKEVSYDTFGNILSDSNEAFRVPFGFAGGLKDNDTGLVRFGYRDYDPYTGKWTAKDPIGFSGGDSNLYGYVLGNPVSFVDPEGLSVYCVYQIKKHRLTCTDYKKTITTDLPYSGDETCKNSIKQECLDDKDLHGPIPPGEYDINPNRKPDKKNHNWWAMKSKKWIPKWSALLHEHGDLRAGFNFHMEGRLGISHGCITFPDTPFIIKLTTLEHKQNNQSLNILRYFTIEKGCTVLTTIYHL